MVKLIISQKKKITAEYNLFSYTYKNMLTCKYEKVPIN